ncbi:WhiB family transcriptional regulator [Candidatus Poriferisodalis sp.]|uniref:WhiB family transcriptional regulator n=1 Tax=Candidatus Poriferisodalis sp. TaxID=3101277 RepID=UPI003B02BC15
MMTLQTNTVYEQQECGSNVHVLNPRAPSARRPRASEPSIHEFSVLQRHGPGSERLAAEWMTRRRCSDIATDVFFPHDGAGVVAAQRLCAECPVKDPCREYALAHQISHGVWGGTSERQRRRILRDRRRAADSASAVASRNGWSRAS